MTNNSNITLTENDFSLYSNASEDFTDPNRELLIEIYVANEYDDANTAEKIKQQILDNQEIVQRLRIALKEKHGTWFNNGCHNLLKSILEKQA